MWPLSQLDCEEPAQASTSKVVAEKAKAVADSSTSAVRSVAASTGLVQPEGELARWRRTFEIGAKTDKDGNKYLDEDAFVAAIAPAGDFSKITPRQYALLFRVADSKKRGIVNFDEFVAFESLLKRPDADFEVAFRVFDINRDGHVSLNEFKRVFSDNLGPDAIPFDFDSPWVKLYLGHKQGDHDLSYDEFTMLMKGLQGERMRQAFRYFDKKQTGYIEPADFARIIRELARHKLSDSVLERLPTLCTITAGQKISYPEVRAFQNVLKEMEGVENIIRTACAKSKDGRINRADFLNTAAQSSRYNGFSPMEVSIIFHFAGATGGDGEKRLALRDFGQLLDPKWEAPLNLGYDDPSTTIMQDLAKGAYSFGLGGIAGAVGATAVYPIDLVKTRMQNQRSRLVGELLYKNGLDCARKVYKNEGLAGFYRGLPPQLVGVAPEKAIKLTVNDLVRRKARDPETGRISFLMEAVAGGAAGGSQVIFTNPLEIVKIRLQMQGEMAKANDAVPRGALHIIRQLGLIGLYKGAGACLLRDVPFSAIYFTSYPHLKTDLFGEGKDGKKLGYTETLLAASIAGMPSAYLTTPADVIKTRLQSEARKGESHYTGMRDCFTKILTEEGPRALFKGGIARVLRSSPQFGVTLLSYETLQAMLPYPFGPAPQVKPEKEDITRIRARNALRILLDVHEDFGALKASAPAGAKA